MLILLAGNDDAEIIYPDTDPYDSDIWILITEFYLCIEIMSFNCFRSMSFAAVGPW